MVQELLIPQILSDADLVRRRIENLDRLSVTDIDLYHLSVASNEIANEQYVVDLVYVENSILEL